MKKLEGKVALDDPTSPIPTWSSGSRPALRSPKSAGKPSNGSGPSGDFDYPAIHSIVSEVLGSWASFMRGIQL
jgi:hypothetical protein